MKTLTFKVSDEEARLIRSLAKQDNVTLSEYLRRRAKGDTPSHRKLKRKRCPQTGAIIFAANSLDRPLSTESVREMLADFP